METIVNFHVLAVMLLVMVFSFIVIKTFSRKRTPESKEAKVPTIYEMKPIHDGLYCRGFADEIDLAYSISSHLSISISKVRNEFNIKSVKSGNFRCQKIRNKASLIPGIEGKRGVFYATVIYRK